MSKCPIVLKYFDVFGTKFTFYTNNKPRLYTMTGGILSTLSIFLSLLSFIFFSLSDLNRNTPILITSYFYEGYKKIKFGKEKIWIPWRIADYNNNKFVNHKGLLFPVIYYYTGYKDKITKDFNITTKILNNKLCNETSMANNSNMYHFSVPLNEVYCIDMDDLDMGGSWIGEFINYVEFDLYFCQDGINFNATDPKCTSYEDIKNIIGQNNSLEMDIYYPIIQYQPTNKTHPLIMIYRQYFYHLSQYTCKIERLFLQKQKLTDDLGWVSRKEINYSYWGISSVDEESYQQGKEKDLMNEGSTSRAFSFNVYLKPDVIYYHRSYKKLYIIASDFFPIAYIIFIIMKSISKIFKKAESNQKSIELLFKRKNRNISLNNLKINGSSNNDIGNNNDNNDIDNNNNNNNIDNNIDNDNNNNKKEYTIYTINNYNNDKRIQNRMNSSSFVLKQYCFNNINFINQKKKFITQTSKKQKKNKNTKKGELFPYSYYLFSVFIKSLDIGKKKKYFFFEQIFKNIYFFKSVI